MTPIDIRLGTAEVIASGTLTVQAPSDIHFHLFGLRIRVVFESNPALAGSIKTKVEDGDLVITCLNMDVPLGTANTIPVRIGMSGNRPVCLDFSNTLHGDLINGRRNFNYTFFFGS